MELKITYKQLLEANTVLPNIMGIKKMPKLDKIFFTKLKRLMSGDMQDLETHRKELAEKYVKVGHERMKAEALASNNDKPVPEPDGVQQPEMNAFFKDYNEYLDGDVTVNVEKIPLSKIVAYDDITADMLYALDWLIDDDVSGKPATPDKKETDE